MRFKRLLAQPVSGASLAVMRMAVGAVMALEAYSLCRPSPSTMGQIPLEVFYTRADIHLTFPYAGFQWLPLLPPHGIFMVVGLMALAAVTMALGLCYRLSAAMVFLTWGYLYVVESTRTYWMSYYYLELLVVFLLVWMPAARRYSVDAWLWRKRNPPATVPYWTIFLLRGQLLITYFYAGVAKFNSDWLGQLEPVRYYLSKARSLTDFAPYLSPAHLALLKRVLLSDTLAYVISYVGLMFDLSEGCLLLFRRTRIFGMLLMLIFHATNHYIIFDDIEWFPLVGMTTALIFLDPDCPERFWVWLRRPKFAKPDWGWFAAGGVLFPGVGAALGWKLKPTRPTVSGNERTHPARPICRAPGGHLARLASDHPHSPLLHTGRRAVHLGRSQLQLAFESGGVPLDAADSDGGRSRDYFGRRCGDAAD